MPRSLQQRERALDLHPSAAVGIVSSEKYWHSPRAWATKLRGDELVVVADQGEVRLVWLGWVGGRNNNVREEEKGRNLPPVHNKSILPRNHLVTHHQLPPGRKPPRARAKR